MSWSLTDAAITHHYSIAKRGSISKVDDEMKMYQEVRWKRERERKRREREREKENITDLTARVVEEVEILAMIL